MSKREKVKRTNEQTKGIVNMHKSEMKTSIKRELKAFLSSKKKSEKKKKKEEEDELSLLWLIAFMYFSFVESVSFASLY